jgi:hypothetical protein
MRSAGPGRCGSIVFTGFIQCCNVTNSVISFFPFQGFFAGATSPETTTQYHKFYVFYVLHTQPSSHTF